MDNYFPKTEDSYQAIKLSRDNKHSQFIVSNSKIKFFPQLILFQLLLIYKYINYSQMLQKIEELTLYIIELKKENKELNKKLNELKEGDRK